MPGYRVTTVETVKGGIVCPHCNLILRDAVQTIEEGHRLCESCYKEICLKPIRMCSDCGISIGEDEQIYPDRAVRRDIQNLLVKCEYHVFGCPWTGKLKDLEDHCRVCRYQPVRCPNEGCSELLPRETMDQHVDEECLFRKTSCGYCGEECRVNQLEEHYTTCPTIPVTCDKCKAKVPRDKLEDHHLNNCPFVQCLGCEKMLKRAGGVVQELEAKSEAELESTEEHLQDPIELFNHMHKIAWLMKITHRKLITVERQHSHLLSTAQKVTVTAAEVATIHGEIEKSMKALGVRISLLERTVEAVQKGRDKNAGTKLEDMNAKVQHQSDRILQLEQIVKRLQTQCDTQSKTVHQIQQQQTTYSGWNTMKYTEGGHGFESGSETRVLQLERKIRPLRDKLPPSIASPSTQEKMSGGHDVTTVEPMDSLTELICPHCKYILRDAVQTRTKDPDDAKNLCESCYKEIYRSDEASPLVECFPDKRMRKEVFSLPVKCNYHSLGCGWKGKLEDLDSHCQRCKVQTVQQQQRRISELEQQVEEQQVEAEQVRKTHLYQQGSCDTGGTSSTVPDCGLTHLEVKCQSETAMTGVHVPELEPEFPEPESGSETHTYSGWNAMKYTEGGHGFESGSETRVLQLERKIEEIERQTTMMKVHVSELELQLQASLTSTHNGAFLWRIPEVSRRKRDAIDERITSIYSPPFYTGRNGYKMCMRAYLNGDGIEYQSHLSVFFVLMKGEFDPLLKWPFDYKVSLILVDQNHRKHIVQTFKPTPESSSFQRPRSDMNVASGCPQFAKLSVLDDDSYVKEDVLYLKCIVDVSRIFHP